MSTALSMNDDIANELRKNEDREHVERVFMDVMKKYDDVKSTLEIYDTFMNVLFHEHYNHYTNNINFREFLSVMGKDLYELNDETIIYIISSTSNLMSAIYHVCKFYRNRTDSSNDYKFLLKEKLNNLCSRYIPDDFDEKTFECLFDKYCMGY